MKHIKTILLIAMISIIMWQQHKITQTNGYLDSVWTSFVTCLNENNDLRNNL